MSDVNVTLRPVTIADARMLLEWRNDATTRNNSRNSEPISLEQHETWLSRVLSSSDHVIRIGESGGAPVGVMRADRNADGWELSWSVAPQARGRGLGGRMLRRFVASLDGRLTAVISRDNVASAKIAAGAGLKLRGDASDATFGLWTRE